MNIKKIKIPCETIPRCGVNPRDSPTVAMAEVVSNRHSDSGSVSTVLMTKRSRQRKDEIQCKNSCGIMDRFFFHPPPEHFGAFLPAEYSKRIGDKHRRRCCLDACPP